MKLLDKLKNVFFEEVEDDEEEIPQTFAKKVEIPKKREKEEVKIKKEEPKYEGVTEEFEIPKEEEKKEPAKTFPIMFDDNDFFEDNLETEEKEEESHQDLFNDEHLYRRESRDYSPERELYQGKRETTYNETVSEKPTYSYTKTYKEEISTKGFKPSPIISPIYGILDKNYRKEEVVTKRETRITSTYGKPDLDSVRNKAFGTEKEDKEVTVKTKKVTRSIDHQKEEKKVYDVNNSKPQVSNVTLADADEYYNDLGLAYNVDYSDVSRTTATRSSKYNQKEKKKETTKSDDNLFDLIDSMYNKED